MKPTQHRLSMRKILRSSLQGAAVVSFIFMTVMVILVGATYIQLKLTDPLDMPALTTLYEKLRGNPEDAALTEQIRQVDHLARKAYFTSAGQVQTGGILILTGLCVFGAAIAGMNILKKITVTSPKDTPVEDTALSQFLGKRGVLVAGGIFAAASAALFVFTLFYGNMTDSAPGAAETKTIVSAEKGETIAENNTNPETETADPVDESSPALDLSAYWPGFRGYHGSAAAASKTSPPAAWDGKTGKNIKWKISVPKPGFNSPMIFADKVIITGATRKDFGIYCHNTQTGALLWKYEALWLSGETAVEVDSQTGYAAATAVTNGTAIAAVFANGDVIGIDFDGKKLWHENIGTPNINYGYSSSPIVFKDILIIQFDHQDGAFLIGKNISTGDTIYKTNRSGANSSWASPVIGYRSNSPVLALAGNPGISLHSPATGALIWKTDFLNGEPGSSPAFWDGLFFAGNYPTPMSAFRADTGEMIWEYWDDTPDVSSPLAANGLVIFASSGAFVTCLEAATGEELWKEEFVDGFYSSPVTAGGRVYLFDREGVCHIFALDKTYNLIAANPLGEPVVSTPAFTGSQLFIRGNKNLYCISQ